MMEYHTLYVNDQYGDHEQKNAVSSAGGGKRWQSKGTE